MKTESGGPLSGAQRADETARRDAPRASFEGAVALTQWRVTYNYLRDYSRGLPCLGVIKSGDCGGLWGQVQLSRVGVQEGCWLALLTG